MMTGIRCGSLRAVSGGDVKFEGWITLDGRIDDQVVLRVHPRARPGEHNSNAPAYEILAVRNGRESSHGSAWIKSSAKVAEFLSMTLDHVNWPRPLNLAAFPPEEPSDGEWSVVWSRPRGVRVQDEASISERGERH